MKSVVAITDAVLTTEWEGGFSQPWTNWLLGELPPGKAGFVGADPKIVQTFLLAALMKINPESEPPGIQPHDWIRSRLEELLSLLDGLVADSELWQALPEVSDVPIRGDRLAQSLEAAARAQQTMEDDVIRAGTLDPAKISELTQAINKGLADHQWIPALFRRDGQLRTPSSEAPEDEKWFGVTQWIPKEMLVAESRFVGIDMFGENLGRAIADGEANSLVEALTQSPRLEIGSGTAREQLENAIQTVRAEGRRPSVILIPLDWRIEDELGLVTAFGSTEAPDWMPQALKHAFHGSIEDIPVFSWQSVQKGRMHLVDIASFGTWTQWRVNAQGETIKIDIEDHSPEEALNFTTAHDNLFRKPEAQSPEERANELGKYLHLSVHERFTLEVLDIAAARWIEVSES